MDNKDETQLNENEMGSQGSPVNRFGVFSADKKDKESIKSRLDETRAKNLNSRGGNLDNGLGNNPSGGLDKKPGLDYGNSSGLNDSGNYSSDSSTSKNKKSSNHSASNSSDSGVGELGGTSEKGKSDVKSNDKGNLNKSQGKGLGLGKALGNTALNVASSNSETVNKTVNTVRTANAALKAIRAVIAFLSSLFGLPLAAMGGIIALIILIIVVIAMIVGSLGSKFGLTGNEVEEIFNGNCPEGYTQAQCDELENLWKEGMTREEIEKIMSDAEGGPGMCKLGFFASIKNFFGLFDLSDNCELAHYVKHLIESKEKQTGIKTIDPGYFMGTLYYSFDTQNYDENGDAYLIPENYDPENPDIVTDLDAITTLFATDPAIYNKGNLETLLNSYIYVEDHKIKPYYLWEEVCKTIGGVEVCDYECVEHKDVYYYIDVLKYKLYLRYGATIRNNYENDRLINDTYAKTHSNCKYLVELPVPMGKYQTKADPSTLTDDKAKIDGIGYDSGFIYKTYPRYNPKYIPGGSSTYDFKTDKDIEQIIENTDSRQDYTNYVLGYPSSVKTDYGTPGGNIIAGGVNPTCSYNINGIDYSNIKVQLVYGLNNLGKNFYDPIEGQELIDFETYITGVTYAEISSGRGQDEAVKAQAIAARSYALSSGAGKLEQVNGEWILSIANGTSRQVYCDPDKGCNKQCGSTNTVFTEGTKPAGLVCEVNSGAISKDSPIRKAVSETAGMILVNSSGQITQARYVNTTQMQWITWASEGLDYVEILRKQYSDSSIQSSDCTYSVSGDWASWKQGSTPWGSIVIGGTPPNNTMAAIGCFATSHAMAIAHGAKNILIPDFNPGSFANHLKANGGFSSGGGLRANVALDLSVGKGNWESTSEFLSGSYESKVAKVKEYLDNGYYVILKVQNAGINGKVWDHYVYVYGVEDGDIIMADPATRVKATRVGKQYPNNGINWIKGIKFK